MPRHPPPPPLGHCGMGRGSEVAVTFFGVQAVDEHSESWPFKEAVDGNEVADYYEVIKDPIGE